MTSVRIGGLRYSSFDEGPGQRTVIWFAGCPIRCTACINPHLIPPDSGERVPLETVRQKLLAGRELGDQGVSFAGGEPFYQPQPLAALCKIVRREWEPANGIPLLIIYSGYTFEVLQARAQTEPSIGEALEMADVLVDGPFIQAYADEHLAGRRVLGYRGSANQRVIDLPGSLAKGEVITLDWDTPTITFVNGSTVMPLALAQRLGLDVAAERHCGALPAETVR